MRSSKPAIVLSLFLLILGLVACEQTGEVVDVIAPTPPDPDLVTVSGPDGQGRLTVTGEAGAVEGNATVLARNATADGSTVSGDAGSNGAFSLQLAGELLDQIELKARDEAGNTSPNPSFVTAGAPFTLARFSGNGQIGIVAETLDSLLVFELTDASGEAVSGQTIQFTLAEGSGSFDPETDETDVDGRVSTELTLGTTAEALIILPSGTSLDIDVVESMSAESFPGPPAAVVWVAGDGQKDAPGQTLQVNPVVKVQDQYGNGNFGQTLDFIASGGGSVTPLDTDTDDDGLLPVQWTLGPVVGDYTLTADAEFLVDAVANAKADDPPSIDNINPTTPVEPGDLIYVYGENFCATPEFNALRLVEADLPFDIVASSETHVSARVPATAQPGPHTLELGVGSQEAPEHPMIELVQPLGEVVDHPFLAGDVDVELLVPSTSSAYAVIPYNVSLVGNYPPTQAIYGIDSEALFARAAMPKAEDPVSAFHRRMLTPPSDEPYRGERFTDPRGDRDVFNCLSNAFGYTNDPANYDQVTATLRYSGTHTLIYVDDDTPAQNLPQNKIDELGDRFDQTDYGIDVAAFGTPTDVDGNGKVAILLSPVVNALTTWSDGSYIGGFFNGVDLDIWNVPAGTSNHGEWFYAIVPDPSGEFSPVSHQIDHTVEGLKSIFAHEFQHMINMGQRHIVQGDAWTDGESLWFNEGLSHLAENLCGYHAQNTARVKLYLHVSDSDHKHSSLTLGGNDLAERGGSYLFCRYLADRWPGISNSLVGGPEVGTDTVSQVTGLDFAQVFKDWIAAIYLDDRDLDGDTVPDDLGPAYRFDSHNLRTDFPHQSGQQEPLQITELHFHNPSYTGGIVPTGMEYLLYSVAGGQSTPDGGQITLSFTGPVSSDMGVLTLRINH